MTYLLVKGEFRLFYKTRRHVGGRPDGDSMWFKPNDPKILIEIEGRKVDYNAGGFAQLRFEGIDALELHYKGPNHQKAPQCAQSRDRLLEMAGFEEVSYAPADDIPTSVRSAVPEVIEGYILTRAVDPYGRPVAFVFVESTRRPDGSEVFLDEDWLDETLNARQIKEGHAYPAFYTGLPADLRKRLTALASQARRSQRNVWKVDKSRIGVSLKQADNLEKYAIWPKLYRRLYAYFADGNKGLKEFESWLRAEPDRDDQLWLISEAELSNMHDIFTVRGNTIRMTVDPEDMVIVPG